MFRDLLKTLIPIEGFRHKVLGFEFWISELLTRTRTTVQGMIKESRLLRLKKWEALGTCVALHTASTKSMKDEMGSCGWAGFEFTDLEQEGEGPYRNMGTDERITREGQNNMLKAA